MYLGNFSILSKHCFLGELNIPLVDINVALPNRVRDYKKKKKMLGMPPV